MKTQIIFLILVLAATNCKSQSPERIREGVDWSNCAVYSAAEIQFESEDVKFECLNCKYLEIETKSGITGIFVMGNGVFNLQNRNMKDSTLACLVRFNPNDFNSFLKISSNSIIEDKGFSAISFNILNDLFKHCYHSGMDALIPYTGDYALNFFSKKYGDVLATFADKKMLIFNFTTGKEM